MAAQTVGYETKAFEPRNLVFFLLIAFGWSWFWWALFIFGILKMPAGIGTSRVDLGSAGPLMLLIALTPFGPTLAGFATAMTEGKPGVRALWFVPGDVHSQTNFWVWAPHIVVVSILMTWIFNKTNGTVLAAILFHSMGNSAGDLIWCCGASERRQCCPARLCGRARF